MGRKRSKVNIFLNVLIWAILIIIIFAFIKGISFKPTDITQYVDQNKETILTTLKLNVAEAPYMKENI